MDGWLVGALQVDMEQEWELPEVPEHSKAGWSPFAGMAVQGKLRKVGAPHHEMPS